MDHPQFPLFFSDITLHYSIPSRLIARVSSKDKWI